MKKTRQFPTVENYYEDGDTTYLLLKENNRYCYLPVEAEHLENVPGDTIEEAIQYYIRNHNIHITSLPHIEKTSKALQYIFNQLSSSDNNMWFVGEEDDEPWKDQKLNLTKKEFETQLDNDIKKYKLEDYIEKGNPEWDHPFNDKLLYTVYGGLQGKFTY